MPAIFRKLSLFALGATAVLLGSCSSQDENIHPDKVGTNAAGSDKQENNQQENNQDDSSVISFEPLPENDNFPPLNEKERTQLIARGKYLTTNVAACGVCHATRHGSPNAPLAGGLEMEDRFGVVMIPNITPDRSTGIGGWSITAIVRAIRSSIGANGSVISLDAHQGYRWMSDRDAEAIAYYLKSLRPIKNAVSRRALGSFERNRFGLISRHSEVLGYVPQLPPLPSAGYGRYLAINVSGCANCHTRPRMVKTPKIFGGNTEATGFFGEFLDSLEPLNYKPIGFPKGGPNIRGSQGLQDWTEEDIIKYLRTGATPYGEVANGSLCPWVYYRGMEERDLKAIARFLKAL